MAYCVVPFLCLITAFILALFLYWYRRLQVRLLYGVSDLENATHMFVEGVDRNVEIVKLEKSDEKLNFRDTFVYRFIKFEYD